MPGTEKMSMDLLYEALYAALSLSDASLQIWISITFAVIVASHFAGHRIRQSTHALVASLYALYSLVLLVRYCSAAYQIIHYQGLLLEQGMEPWPVPKFVGLLIGVGTFVLITGGTIATLWFVNVMRKEHEAHPR